MENKKNREIILSIETTIEGGSLSILENGTEIGGWTGERSISKAEDVLDQISKLLVSNNLRKEQIKLICVSKEAGSSTGEKIGQAIAKGLCQALNCQLARVSILDAMLLALPQNFRGSAVVVITTGKNHIYWQFVKKTNSGFYKKMPLNSKKDEFHKELKSINYEKLIAFRNSSEISDFLPDEEKAKVVLVKHKPSTLIGLTMIKNNASDNINTVLPIL